MTLSPVRIPGSDDLQISVLLERQQEAPDFVLTMKDFDLNLSADGYVSLTGRAENFRALFRALSRNPWDLEQRKAVVKLAEDLYDMGALRRPQMILIAEEARRLGEPTVDQVVQECHRLGVNQNGLNGMAAVCVCNGLWRAAYPDREIRLLSSDEIRAARKRVGL